MERNIGGIREEKINVEMITFRGHEMLCYVLKILILEDDDRKMMKVSRKVEKTDVKLVKYKYNSRFTLSILSRSSSCWRMLVNVISYLHEVQIFIKFMYLEYRWILKNYFKK